MTSGPAPVPPGEPAAGPAAPEPYPAGTRSRGRRAPRGRRRWTGRFRPARLPLRARLTLIHSGLFMVAGVVLLGVTYVLFEQQMPDGAKFIGKVQQAPTAGPPGTPSGSPRPPETTFTLPDGEEIPPDGAVALKEHREALRNAAATSLLSLGGLVLVVVGGGAAGFGWLVSGRVLAPLRRVTETARRIAAAPAAGRGLHERIALAGPRDEVKDLADTFDTMIERLDRSFDGQRRFVANASHELRTPLTLGRALVEVAMHRRTASDDVKQLGEDLLEINLRHERLIGGLLLLADSENEVTERIPLDLADVVTHVAAQAAAEARSAGVTVDESAAEAPTSGNALLLERLVHNLVENGIRHNSGPGGFVRVTSRPAPGGGAVLEVANTGPPVSPFDVPTLFEPFRRLGRDRVISAKGAGLGLSIVRAVARAHGGTVTARPREGGGLVVTAVLPP
ncbi:sensor histidine kinase [Streptomyces tsukubensis]|uniref:histidine kinase n=1 Tax=Streptomyces tsukubensis (strain DSM 42081 / NBRC 108919 / NRRL 18488 / 9993) TaxID=1114943 RepID=A0A7G3UM72_STRT9|nr:HAMP domain-containing sensor histidine kinase [Streptomyces tsukubensis]AZK93549.1 two-component sensor histidine kinase [Streptomyces tsukubensis]QKM70300.1 two-component sensor histidine kinase [Streptomyces tsukubensis NRRL18488]TAI45715.1 HAMP domain-containing histidine kinase [Streptomyces tsukubensis]